MVNTSPAECYGNYCWAFPDPCEKHARQELRLVGYSPDVEVMLVADANGKVRVRKFDLSRCTAEELSTAFQSMISVDVPTHSWGELTRKVHGEASDEASEPPAHARYTAEELHRVVCNVRKMVDEGGLPLFVAHSFGIDALRDNLALWEGEETRGMVLDLVMEYHAENGDC